jgi:hypothetical protein
VGIRARPVRKVDRQPSVSRLSRQSEILNISQPYKPPRSITGIALFFIFTSNYMKSSLKIHQELSTFN